jgi:type II secretory pathway pseudopilin PulG
MTSTSFPLIPTKISFYLITNLKGYLLAEVMIAIAIFSIGFAAIGTLVLSTTNNNTTGNILTQATMLATETLEQFKTATLMDLAVGAYSDSNNPVDEKGNSGGIFNRSWVIDDPIGYDTARRIRVTVSWDRLGKNRAVELTTITRGRGT